MTVSLSIGLVEPIGEWRTLVKVLTEFLDREDISDIRATDMIALAEARFNRVLRHPEMEEISSTTLVFGNNDLPADFLALKSLHASDREIKPLTVSGLIGRYGDAIGIPRHYTLAGGNPRKIRLGPQPFEALPVTLYYYKKIMGVNEENSDNWLLNEHPDVYLAGCLVWSEAYLTNDERVPMWKAAVDEFLAEMELAGQRDRFGGSLDISQPFPCIRGVRA